MAASPPSVVGHRPIRPQESGRPGLLALVAAGALLLSACGSGSDETGTATSEPAATTGPAEVSIPGTPVGGALAWVLGVLAGEPTEEADVTDRVSPTTLEQLPAADLLVVLEQLAAGAPWVVTAYDGTDTEAVATIESSSQGRLDVQTVVDPDGLLAGLLFTPAAGDRTAAASWADLAANVEALPAETSLVVTEVTGGTAGEQLLAVGPGDAQPLGSVAKLYVLGAVVTAVEEGELSWEEQLTITDDVKSLPSGQLQDAPSGSTVTVREAAQKMIEISDNTATDLLVDAVGRVAVERAVAAMGHSDPALMTPFPTTRALFQLGWGQNGELRQPWADGDAAQRAALLGGLPTGLVDAAAGDLVDAVWTDGIDWFATPADLVAAHLALQELAGTEAGEPIRDIVSANPGFGPDVVGEWDHVAFKGGSSIGVLAGSWYVEDADRSYVVTLQAATGDPAAVADQAAYFGQVEDALALLAGR